jgi:hypothetical protein
MEQKITGALLSLCLAIFVITSGFLISATGLAIDYFLTINLLPLADGFLSIYFILFIITSSISLMLIGLIIRKTSFQQALVFSLLGYIIGVLVTVFFFIQLEFIFALLFTAFGIVVSIKLYHKTDEKFTQKFKTGASISGKIIIFFGIGIFITIILITAPNANEYETNFSNDIVESFIGGEGDSLSAPLLSSLGQLQKETLLSIQKTPEYLLMQSKNDSDFLKLEMKIEEFKTFYTSDKYSKTISKNTKDFVAGDNSGEQLNLELPFVKDLAKYAWLIYALLALASVLFIGELIMKNLSALLFALFSKTTKD